MKNRIFSTIAATLFFAVSARGVYIEGTGIYDGAGNDTLVLNSDGLAIEPSMGIASCGYFTITDAEVVTLTESFMNSNGNDQTSLQALANSFVTLASDDFFNGCANMLLGSAIAGCYYYYNDYVDPIAGPDKSLYTFFGNAPTLGSSTAIGLIRHDGTKPQTGGLLWLGDGAYTLLVGLNWISSYDATVIGGSPQTPARAIRLMGPATFPLNVSLNVLAVNGSITGGGEFEYGSTARLTAIPQPGYLFVNWSGDATGTGNPIDILMNFPKTVTASFAPDTNDDDEDGLTNYREIVELGTNPALKDTDGDDVEDGDDAFPLDINEWLDTDGDGIGDNADTDDDGDGLSDEDEINIYGTNPKRADSDGDGLSDYDEIFVHLTNPLVADTDQDGLNDGAEILTYQTNPKVADTDGDGFLDGYEVLTGKSPLDPLEKPTMVAEARTAIEFTFPSALGRIYRIEDSLDLSTWETVESGIHGNGAVIQRFYSIRNMPKRYFRVEEETP